MQADSVCWKSVLCCCQVTLAAEHWAGAGKDGGREGGKERGMEEGKDRNLQSVLKSSKELWEDCRVPRAVTGVSVCMATTRLGRGCCCF